MIGLRPGRDDLSFRIALSVLLFAHSIAQHTVVLSPASLIFMMAAASIRDLQIFNLSPQYRALPRSPNRHCVQHIARCT